VRKADAQHWNEIGSRRIRHEVSIFRMNRCTLRVALAAVHSRRKYRPVIIVDRADKSSRHETTAVS
jgi:hypothetical protein